MKSRDEEVLDEIREGKRGKNGTLEDEEDSKV